MNLLNIYFKSQHFLLRFYDVSVTQFGNIFKEKFQKSCLTICRPKFPSISSSFDSRSTFGMAPFGCDIPGLEKMSLNGKLVQNSKNILKYQSRKNKQHTQSKSTTCLLVRWTLTQNWEHVSTNVFCTSQSNHKTFENDAMQNVINSNTLHDHFDEITASIWIANQSNQNKNKTKKQWSKEVTTHTTGVQLRSYSHKRSSILKTEIAMFFISDTIQNRSRNSQTNEGNQKK